MGYGKVAPAPDMSIASAGPIAAAAMKAPAVRVRKSFKALSSVRDEKLKPTWGWVHGWWASVLVVGCWCMVNNTPGITAPTHRVIGRFRGCPHPYASHVIVL